MTANLDRFIDINGEIIPALFDVLMEHSIHHIDFRKKKVLYFGRRNNIFYSVREGNNEITMSGLLPMLLWNFEVRFHDIDIEGVRVSMTAGSESYELHRSDNIFWLPIILNIPSMEYRSHTILRITNLPGFFSKDDVSVSAEAAYFRNLQAYTLSREIL